MEYTKIVSKEYIEPSRQMMQRLVRSRQPFSSDMLVRILGFQGPEEDTPLFDTITLRFVYGYVVRIRSVRYV